MPLTVFRQSHHLAGNAPDTTPTQFDLWPPAMRFDMAIFDNPVLVSFSADLVYYTTEREISPGLYMSLDQVVRSFRIRNKTALAIGRFDVTAFYSPMEVVGEPFVPTQSGS